jgi:hypothetical protein
MSEQQKKALVMTGVAVGGAALLAYVSREVLQYGKEQAIIAGIPLAGLLIPLLVAALGYAMTQAKRA